MMNFAGVRSSLRVFPLKATPDPGISTDVSKDSVRSKNSLSKRLLSGLLIAIIYYFALQLGFAFKPPHEPISAFWPPNAILLAAFLMTPRNQWWVLVSSILPAHLLFQLHRGVPITTSLGWFVGNAGEGLIGAYLITEVQHVPELFEHVRGLLIFLAFGVFGAPLLTSFLDIGSVVATGLGRDFWRLWTTRQLADMLAALTVVPPIILFRTYGVGWFRNATWTRYLEGALLALATVASIVYAFLPGNAQRKEIQLLYILLVLLSWATLRFRFAGLSATLLVICLFSTWAVVHGRAPYLALPENVIPLQVFLFMVALPSMFIVVALVQQSETAKSLRESTARLVNSQEQERSRVARELHDGVGQLLSLVEVKLAQLAEGNDSEIGSSVEELKREVAEISQATRDISHGLHPAHLEYLGLPTALRKLCKDFSREHVLDIVFHETGVPEHLNSNVSLSLYRVAQEAMHNAAKYSRAKHIEMRLQLDSGQLLMVIKDDGIGFSSTEKTASGMGLLNMQDRMESVGGRLSIKSAPGKGTRVRASIDLCNAA